MVQPNWPRLQTQYSLHRTDTGRLSSGTADDDDDKTAKRNQLQNVPKKLRDMIVPEDGYVFVGGDWAGIEWAIAMWFCSKVSTVANCPAMGNYHINLLDRFWNKELDPHRYLASFAFGIPEEQVTKDQRQICKAYTHGRTFDGSPVGLARSVGHPDRVGIRVCKAHDEAFLTGDWKKHTVRLAEKQHYIQTPLGWRRYFWEWPPKSTEILGTLVQGTTADLCKWVLRKAFEDGSFELSTTTHDSILVHAPAKRGQEAKEWLLRQMQQPIPWLDGRRWRADVRVGDSWRRVS